MKKKVAILVGLMLFGLVGCVSVQKEKTVAGELVVEGERIGMANPASVFCEESGGRSVVVKAADDSELGVCVFPDGRCIDEWDFYREHAVKRLR